MDNSRLYNEKELFGLIAEGDKQAFAAVVEFYFQHFYKLMLKHTKRPAEAEAIVQRVFVQLWEKREQLAKIDNPTSWLFSITRNEFKDWEKRAILLHTAGEAKFQSVPGDQLYRELQETRITGPLGPEQLKRIWTAIGARPQKPEVRLRRKRRPVWYVAVGLTLLSFSAIGIVLWTASHRTVANLVAAIDHIITPDSNRVTLTLSDGIRINLDSAGKGVISQQGVFNVIKLDNGQVVYLPRLDINRQKSKSTDELAATNTLATSKGKQYRLELPDGTNVWLNAVSSITYPVTFSGRERRVKVTGEVYFEVAADKQRPFVVNVNDGAEINVLGTTFNVNCYTDEEDIRATLIEGSIRVRAEEQVVLRPREQAIWQKEQSPETDKDVDIEQITAWKDGRFNFNHSDLPTVMHELARWYGLDIRYEGPVSPLILRGETTRDVDLSEVLKLLEAAGAKFRVEGKTVVVLS